MEVERERETTEGISEAERSDVASPSILEGEVAAVIRECLETWSRVPFQQFKAGK